MLFFDKCDQPVYNLHWPTGRKAARRTHQVDCSALSALPSCCPTGSRTGLTSAHQVEIVGWKQKRNPIPLNKQEECFFGGINDHEWWRRDESGLGEFMTKPAEMWGSLGLGRWFIEWPKIWAIRTLVIENAALVIIGVQHCHFWSGLASRWWKN